MAALLLAVSIGVAAEIDSLVVGAPEMSPASASTDTAVVAAAPSSSQVDSAATKARFPRSVLNKIHKLNRKVKLIAAIGGGVAVVGAIIGVVAAKSGSGSKGSPAPQDSDIPPIDVSLP